LQLKAATGAGWVALEPMARRSAVGINHARAKRASFLVVTVIFSTKLHTRGGCSRT
jgi:hypothetical protein